MASSSWLWGNIPKWVGPKAKASGDEAITTLPALKLRKIYFINKKAFRHLGINFFDHFIY
jgi:hypothetical protein